MTDPYQTFIKSKKRGEDIRRRAADPEGFEARCVIPGCGQPTMRAEGTGLAAFHCKRHVDHKARHGSHWHGTYRAADIAPYRKAADRWLKANAADSAVVSAVGALRGLLDGSGPFTPSTSLRGLPVRDRARIAFVRLARAEIKPETILAIHLAMSALIEEDPGSHRVREFRVVQVAKAVHRLASGYHRKWEFEGADGKTRATELHGYARSTGRVLRLIGEEIDRACEMLAADHMADVMALKVERYGTHPRKPQGPADR
ncbi:hypothetical protein ANOBCDAF_03426 [Pleomorphomonas sp. T1.2MG-36]|uniref:hypothetical protein n=1 Tax=Pleomorphomonas sp. T1.2MG-36 TaxID=3041167 RepID=UPI0024778D14|nr:hypothetical protein [Pleomorphomonas sp. T1.2MG-36]CAI9415291.1 hypothetical protein ANOBCDAF_03426 [Pleomorphomonas sp. T1.2MG-36]